MNFHDTAVKMTPKDVNQQFKLAAEAGAGPKADVVGVTADAKALAKAGLTGGDAAAGEQLYTSLGCAGCHLAGAVAPATKGTFTRITDQRLKDNPGKWDSPEEYIADSILHPNNYVVPNFAAGVMPQDFGTKLTLPELKNIIAFIETQK